MLARTSASWLAGIGIVLAAACPTAQAQEGNSTKPGVVLAAEAAPVELRSPDGAIKVTVEESVGDAPPTYRIERKGETVIAPSPLGLDILYAKNFGPFDISGTQRRSVAGVMGAEYNKWSNLVTSRYNVTIPFARMVLGPIDYTPGGFINVKPQDFKFRWTDPMVQTTRGQQPAMFVVYESPLQSVADSLDRYRNAAGFDFIKAVPADWDETRFIAGDIGEYVVLARRKRSEWYVGAMTNETARTIDIPLSFLGATKFRADTWQAGATPTDIASAHRDAVSGSDMLTLKLAANGGATARFRPIRSVRP